MHVSIEIVRPSQWYKNMLIFIPLIFSLNLFDLNLWFLSMIGFLALCLAFGGSYVINDVLDYKRDMFHPRKSKRPVAAGRISRGYAISYAVLLVTVAMVIGFFLGTAFLIINSLIITLTISYSIVLKNIFLVEAFIIAINYVLRAISGAVAIDVKASPWLIIGIFFLALLLVLGKRKNETSFLNGNAVQHRPVLRNYTPVVRTPLQ